MGRTFRIKVRMRRFRRQHPRIAFAIRSFMIFSATFGAAYGFIAGSRSDVSGYDPNAFAVGASFLFALACLGLAMCAHSQPRGTTNTDGGTISPTLWAWRSSASWGRGRAAMRSMVC